MRTYITIIILLIALKVDAQYYRYWNNKCKCGSDVTNPYFEKEQVEDYFKSMLTISKVESLNGNLFLLVYVDKKGNTCCRTILNMTGQDVSNLKLFRLIRHMPKWKPAIYEDAFEPFTPAINEPISSKVTLRIKFSNHGINVDTTNMDSLGINISYTGNDVKIDNKSYRDERRKPKIICEVFNNENSLMPCNYSRAISIDKEGAIWGGTDNGLVRIFQNKMTTFNYRNSILKQDKRPAVGPGKTKGILSSAVDSSNNKWFSDGYNIYRFDNLSWIAYDTTTLPIQWCTYIYASKNSVEFATFKGAMIYENCKWHTIDSATYRLPSRIIYTIFNDSKSNRWIGTRDGTICIQDTSIVDFSKSNTPLNTNSINCIAEDWDNNIWFGINNADQTGGIAVLSENGDWQTFNISNSNIPSNSVWDIAIDKERKRIWMGIAGVGIVLFKNGEWYAYTPENSKVPSIYVFDIDIDINGDIWAATSNGILHLRLVEK